MSYDHNAASIGEGAKWFIGAVVAIVVIGAIIFGGWQLNWWFKSQDTNRQSHLYEHEYGHQSALIEDIANKHAVLDEINVQIVSATGDQLVALRTQRLGIATVICKDSNQINGNLDGVGAGDRHFIKTNCDGSAVAVNSPLRP